MQLKTLKRLVGKFRISTIAAPENEAIKSVLCHLSVENKFFNQSDFADRLAIYVHTSQDLEFRHIFCIRMSSALNKTCLQTQKDRCCVG